MLAVAGAAAGDALTELLGLNKSPSENFGDAVGLAAGLAAASVFAFLRARFASGETAGLADIVACRFSLLFSSTFRFGRRRWRSAVEGEAACSAGEAAASDFFVRAMFFW